jgi:acetyl esterase/lipase
VRTLAYLLLPSLAVWATLAPSAHADGPAFTRTQDVVYGRKDGTALTLDVFAPKEHANGAAVVWVVSGGWVSNHNVIDARFQFSPIE